MICVAFLAMSLVFLVRANKLASLKPQTSWSVPEEKFDYSVAEYQYKVKGEDITDARLIQLLNDAYRLDFESHFNANSGDPHHFYVSRIYGGYKQKANGKHFVYGCPFADST